MWFGRKCWLARANQASLRGRLHTSARPRSFSPTDGDAGTTVPWEAWTWGAIISWEGKSAGRVVGLFYLGWVNYTKFLQIFVWLLLVFIKFYVFMRDLVVTQGYDGAFPSFRKGNSSCVMTPSMRMRRQLTLVY
jgi:hypothetical protein